MPWSGFTVMENDFTGDDVKYLVQQQTHMEGYDAHQCHSKLFTPFYNNYLEIPLHFDSVLLHSNNILSKEITRDYLILGIMIKETSQHNIKGFAI